MSAFDLINTFYILSRLSETVPGFVRIPVHMTVFIQTVEWITSCRTNMFTSQLEEDFDDYLR